MAQMGDVIHEDVFRANAATHMRAHTHTNETAESQGFALRSAYKDGIDIWLPADTF